MRDDERFEVERAFDLLPHVVGASWATLWFRLGGNKNPTPEEFREKVVEYFGMLDGLCGALPRDGGRFDDATRFIQGRMKHEIQRIRDGLNDEIEKRYDRYVDYG